MSNRKVQFQVQEITNGLLILFPGETRNGVTTREPETIHVACFEDMVDQLKDMIPNRLKRIVGAGLIAPS